MQKRYIRIFVGFTNLLGLKHEMSALTLCLCWDLSIDRFIEKVDRFYIKVDRLLGKVDRLEASIDIFYKKTAYQTSKQHFHLPYKLDSFHSTAEEETFFRFCTDLYINIAIIKNNPARR